MIEIRSQLNTVNHLYLENQKPAVATKPSKPPATKVSGMGAFMTKGVYCLYLQCRH